MDWIGNVFIVIGLWLIGSKRRSAFLFSIIGEMAWMIYSLCNGLYSLAFITAIFALLAVRSWFKWKPERTKE